MSLFLINVTKAEALKLPTFLSLFQVGRRKCVGEDFGKAMILALISSFLKRYDLKLQQAYDFTEEPAVAFTRAPNDFTLILDPIF